MGNVNFYMEKTMHLRRILRRKIMDSTVINSVRFFNLHTR